MKLPVRTIAFYLPQFHPIPENDEWWGKGFTEWTNVARAKPLFRGHYQPHIPADLGFYDLRCPETRQAQAEIAREYGIYGFCYYHYWFNGKQLLERPFKEVLESGNPDFPFCLCWANENWTRKWDGHNENILIAQNNCNEDDIAHIRSVIPAFRDKRYIRINDKPLFLVYRTLLLRDAARTAETWRREARDAGIGDLYLAKIEGHGDCSDPRKIGFDASVEFPAHPGGPYRFKELHNLLGTILVKAGIVGRGYIENYVLEYKDIVKMRLRIKDSEFTRFHSVLANWDNSTRKDKAVIVVGSTPELYEDWLKEDIDRTVKKYSGDERIIFLCSWNEWAEGSHLEPDLKYGKAYLEATRRALEYRHVEGYA